MKIKVTDKAAKRLFELRQTYVDKALKPDELDEDRLKEDVAWLYSRAGINPPKIFVVNSWKDALMLCDSLNRKERCGEGPGRNIGIELKNIILEAKQAFDWECRKRVTTRTTLIIRASTYSFVSREIGELFLDSAEGELLRRIGRELLFEMGSRRKTAERIYIYASLLSQGHVYRLNAERDRGLLRGKMSDLGFTGFSFDFGKLVPFFWYFGVLSDFPSLVYYDAVGRVCGVRGSDWRVLVRVRDMLFNGVFSLHAFGKVAVATRAPRLRLSQDGVLHSVDEAAVRWVGDYRNYFLFGQGISEATWKYLTSPKMSYVRACRVKDEDLRSLALSVLGPERIFDESRPSLVAESERGNSLWANSIDDQKIHFLRYKCPSTGKTYTKFVPAHLADPDEAQARSFRINLDEYRNLAAEC